MLPLKSWLNGGSPSSQDVDAALCTLLLPFTSESAGYAFCSC